MPRFPFGGGGGVPPDYLEAFAQNIEAIKESTKLTATLIPAEIAKMTTQLAQTLDVYKNAGPSRGTPGGASTSGQRSGYSSIDDVDATARKALYARQTGRPTDPYEAQIEGDTMTGTRVATTWQGRVQPGLGNILPLPRYPGAEPNAADLLNYTSVVAANIAKKRQDSLDRKTSDQKQALIQQAKDRGDISTDSDGNIIGDTPEYLQQALDQVPSSETNMGKVSDILAGAESGYTQSRYIKGIISKMARPINNLRDLGYQTGAEGGSPGLFGIRAPWDPSVIAGLKQEASKWGLAASNNVTPHQAGTIYGNLYERGWMSGGQTDLMRQTAAQMMQNNPYIASMPQYYDMLDKATRQGATSLQGFNEVMKGIPDSALAAHTSIAQTMADMDQMGQLNKGMGGTYGAGLQNAQAWQNTTGLPANIMATLMQNPLVQGQTFMGTGLMPWEQGLASPGQHMQAILNATNMLSGMVSTPSTLHSKDSIGLDNQISGQDQKEALLSHFLGVDKATVHTMLTNKQGWQAGINIGQSASDYQNTIRRDVQQGNLTGANQTLTGAPWQAMQNQLGSAVDAQGHKMFEDWAAYNKFKKLGMSDAKAHQAAQITALQNIQHAGDKELSKGHMVYGPRGVGGHWVAAQNTGATMAQIAKDRAAEIRKYQSENTQKFGSSSSSPTGPQLQIELGPAAKKVFHLSDPNNAQKASQNAGAVSVNTNSWATGPTFSPTPNLDTAGSQYNTGGY